LPYFETFAALVKNDIIEKTENRYLPIYIKEQHIIFSDFYMGQGVGEK
jgi:hypothetical protein